MGGRLYTLRRGQGYFETGLAGGRQVLLGNTVREIVVHWFDADGRLVGLERFPMAVDPPTFPGSTIVQAGDEYWGRVEGEMGVLKERIGFQSADVRLLVFESDEASIVDLPGEYQRFLEYPEPAAPREIQDLAEEIAAWQADGRFVLEWCGEYWLSADGEVIARG